MHWSEWCKRSIYGTQQKETPEIRVFNRRHHRRTIVDREQRRQFVGHGNISDEQHSLLFEQKGSDETCRRNCGLFPGQQKGKTVCWQLQVR